MGQENRVTHVHKCAVYECEALVECTNNPCLEDVSVPDPPCCPTHMPIFNELWDIIKDVPITRVQLFSERHGYCDIHEGIHKQAVDCKNWRSLNPRARR